MQGRARVRIGIQILGERDRDGGGEIGGGEDFRGAAGTGEVGGVGGCGEFGVSESGGEGRISERRRSEKIWSDERAN